MKKTFFIAALGLAAASLTAQSKETREVSGFSSIKVSSAIQVVLTMGDKESLKLEADENALKKIKSEVKNGELILSCDRELKNSGEMKAFITAKQIKKLDANGASHIKLTNKLETEKLEVEASGASVVNLELKVKELQVEIQGASIAKITGEATVVDVDVEGASQFKGSDLKAEEVDVEASGASQASVNAEKNITIKAAGASNVTYKGSPQIKDLNSTGASSVKKG